MRNTLEILTCYLIAIPVSICMTSGRVHPQYRRIPLRSISAGSRTTPKYLLIVKNQCAFVHLKTVPRTSLLRSKISAQ